MKKLFLTISLATAVAFVNAQDMTSKKGVPILPEAGDWSIGFDVVPVLRTMGNVFQPNGGSGPYSQVTNTLVGLYVKDETTAYRAKLRIGIGSNSQDNLVDDDSYTGTGTTPKVTDNHKESSMNITIGGGIQKSMGKGRLHGIYGAEIGFMIGSGKHTYTYGNAFSVADSTPTSTTDWNTFASGSVSSRTTEQKNGSTFGLSLNGFIGAEFFFAPKMSVSAEYGWGLIANNGGPGLSSTGEGETTSQGWSSGAATSTTAKTGGSSSFSLDVMNATSIVLHCYF